MLSLEVDQLAGFLTDPYTVLEPTHDRVMATSLVAQWRFNSSAGKWSADWEAVYAGVKTELVKQFAVVHSLALQQTLYEMGKAVLEHYPVIAEVRLSALNKHHFRYDLSRFGLANNNEVFHADDRPYGLIQATVTRDDARIPGLGTRMVGLSWVYENPLRSIAARPPFGVWFETG